jgi:hypothetical protein
MNPKMKKYMDMVTETETVTGTDTDMETVRDMVTDSDMEMVRDMDMNIERGDRNFSIICAVTTSYLQTFA